MRFKADIGESNIAALFKEVTLNRGRPKMSSVQARMPRVPQVEISRRKESKD